ncbi:FAD-dependent oxidoreductase [Litorimonas sp.]|uniref:FAD-dependent oxidoreductase n=1 Tax=Litorimonas sp. TaxID=1892381 RepID=UPI003A8A255B
MNQEKEKKGETALIAGAGIAGLAAAAALAAHFDEVIIFEKDDAAAIGKISMGAVQGGHIHTMLRGGEAGLEVLLPGIRDQFVAGGAIELDMGGDYRGHDGGTWREQAFLDMPILMMSRPGYEKVIRERVIALENVSIRSACRVANIAFENDCATGLRIICGDEELSQAGDLVVDARGRGSLLPIELEKAGFGQVPETKLGILMSYVSGHFKQKEENPKTRLAMLVRPTAPERRYGILCPIEDNQWMVTLGGRADTVPPTEYEGFCDYAQELAVPDFYNVFKDCELVGPLRRYKKPTADWRHYDQMSHFPGRLIPLGDTITSINPTFGQGMTLAVLHALSLSNALNAHAIDAPKFLDRYFDDAMKISGAAWHMAGNSDLEYDFVTGTRPEGFEQMQQFSKGLKLLANKDKNVLRILMEVFHLERPAADLRESNLAARVMKVLNM